MMRRRRLWIVLIGGLAWLIASLIYLAWPGRSTFTISPETTYVTEPLDKHGYVDYVAAVNERLGKGITPENNANVLIVQVLGPHPRKSTLIGEYYQWLGIEPLPQEGEYLIPWEDYLQAHNHDDGKGTRDPNIDPNYRAKCPWITKEDPELATWLKQNEKPLGLLVAASRRPAYYNPLVPIRSAEWSPGLFGALLPTVQECRWLASALACRAMLRLGEGKTEEAQQDLLACHRLARLESRGGTLIELYVALAMERVARQADLLFLDRAKLNSKQILAYEQQLQHLPAMATVADKLDLGERFMLLDTMMVTAHHGASFLESTLNNAPIPPPPGQSWTHLFARSIDWDPALSNANRWTDRIIAALHARDHEARLREMGPLKKELTDLRFDTTHAGWLEKALLGRRARGEMIGNILITLLLASFDKAQDATDRCEQEDRNLHVAFALAAYHHDHGRYPAQLRELAPRYLETIPLDLFSSRPLIYQPNDKGYLLYNVGPDGEDDGGRGRDDDPPGDDLNIRMPVPPPRKQ